MPIINKFRYRPEIDGLRAVAVLAVVLFHAGFGFPGGYIGVDIFFVISGFLITSLIWKELESGTFTFTNFWERRARRILPALVVVTIVTLVAGSFLLLPEDYRSLGRATTFQTAFAANIHYWQTTGYFAGASDDKPLLHTWSLAVEEQFYFVVPFLLWAIFGVVKFRSRLAITSLIGTVMIVSLALNIFQVNARQTASFYLLPARSWELLLGSLVALLPTSPLLLVRREPREILSLVSIGIIFIPIFTYSSNTPFPGLAALPPCLGAALFIWTNGHATTSLSSLLSTRPVIFIGLISYSLYLWHWPFLAFSKYLLLEPASVIQRVALIVLGFLFAILSWKYVETPFRKRIIGSSRKSMFTFAAVGVATVFLCGFLCWALNGFPKRFSSQSLKFSQAKSDMSFINEHTLDDIRSEKLVPLGVTNPRLRPTVLVWGDSHAMAALPAVNAFLKEKKLAGRAATHSTTPPVFGWFAPGQFSLREQSMPFNDAVFSYIEKYKIPYVILSAYWGSYTGTNDEKATAFNTALLTTVQRITAIGSQPIILLDVPIPNFNVPRALSLPIYSQAYIISLCAKPKEQCKFDMLAPKTIDGIEAAGGRIIDPKPSFLDPTGRYYIVQKDSIAMYRDEQHLTTEGAKLILLPLLRDSLPLK